MLWLELPFINEIQKTNNRKKSKNKMSFLKIKYHFLFLNNAFKNRRRIIISEYRKAKPWKPYDGMPDAYCVPLGRNNLPGPSKIKKKKAIQKYDLFDRKARSANTRKIVHEANPGAK